MGMAAATGLDANGEQTDFYGAAPDAALVDVRIGTDAGAGPFENYLLSQEFYESAMNGLQWIIDHKDDAWQVLMKANMELTSFPSLGESLLMKAVVQMVQICTAEFSTMLCLQELL